jgi:hypothetical protein
MYKKIYLEFIQSGELDIKIFIKLFNDGYISNIENVKLKVERMKKIYRKNPEIDVDDMFSNDYEEIIITPKYFFSICCVMLLYSNLEQKLKGILENIFEFDISKCYIFKNIKRKFFSKSGINLEDINNYKYIDELRELNKCIKHNRYVSVNLEKISNNKYKSGDRINVSEEIIIEYSDNIRAFLYDLYKKIENVLSKSNGT